MTAFARAVLQNDFEIADVLLAKGNAYKGYVNRKEGKSIADIAKRLKNNNAVNYISNASGGASK